MIRLMALAWSLATISLIQSVAQADGLMQIYEKAVIHDARFAAAKGSYAAGVEKFPQGAALLLPSLSARGSSVKSDGDIHYDGTTSFQSGDRRYDDNEVRVTLTQPIYNYQSFATFQQGSAQRKIAEAQFTAAKQDLIVRTAQAYLDLLAAQRVLAAASAHFEATNAQLAQAKAKLSVGAGSRLDLADAKARASLAHQQRISAEHDVLNKQQALQRIIGSAPGELNQLSDTFPLIPPAPDNANAWVTIAEQDSPQLLALRESVTASEKEVQKARGGHHPTVNLEAQYLSGDSSGSVYTSAASDTRVKSYGIHVELPIYQGGMVNSRVREAIGQLEKAQGEFDDARREIQAQVVQNYNGVVMGIQQVHALEQALLSSEEAAKGSRIGREVGTRSFVEVLDAERQVYEVTRELTKAKHEYFMSWLKLRAAAGQLSEENLARVDRYLVPPPKLP